MAVNSVITILIKEDGMMTSETMTSGAEKDKEENVGGDSYGMYLNEAAGNNVGEETDKGI